MHAQDRGRAEASSHGIRRPGQAFEDFWIRRGGNESGFSETCGGVGILLTQCGKPSCTRTSIVRTTKASLLALSKR